MSTASPDIPLLVRLLEAHSTPGDEGAVAGILEAGWASAGWTTRRLGAFATVARRTPPPPARRSRRPALLVTAHMDSPGFVVDRLPSPGAKGAARRSCGLATLGGPDDGKRSSVPALLRTREGLFPVSVRCREGCWEAAWTAKAAPRGLALGDRVCFEAKPAFDGPLVTSPFLDNRLGCWLLARIAREASTWKTPFDIVLGATGGEEHTGFGAAVLAARTAPDAVVVLDATYENADQGVTLGGGPVLTLSDASVLLSPALRDAVTARLAPSGAPLQHEVYNRSGTDARAFPRAGLPATILPLLLPTRGNHGPAEAADLRDADALLNVLRILAESWPEPLPAS